jgi:hypothetical protein
MTHKQIRVEISAEGVIRAETVGIVGQKCLDYVVLLEQMMDAESTESSFTDDYLRNEDTENLEFEVDSDK